MTSQQPALSASMNSMAPMSASAVHGDDREQRRHARRHHAGAAMTAAAPAATVLPSMTLQPNVVPALDKSLNEKPVTEKAGRQDPERQARSGTHRVGEDPGVGRRARCRAA